MERVEDI